MIAPHAIRSRNTPPRGGVVIPARAPDRAPSASSPHGTPDVSQESETRRQVARPWNVVVHNDPINLMSYVTYVFQRVFGYSLERAREFMLRVHFDGRAIVWSGEREHAEFYVQQLHGHQLLATIEPVD